MQQVLHTGKADKDPKIFEFRKKLLLFLETSDMFEPNELLKLIPADYLFKEKALVLVKAGRFEEAYHICIENLNDIEFAHKLAQRGYKWHNKNIIYE
eukprot:CAMPEP_0116871800 /NCGR_PEP_ID=MMETSP0463-20121206/2297_1 /TAXON_ID=181622 /ORGANISM="Strombidinopsis sp, Strain SopsisLIS2011" /LENGTH=96 /DNA_ID=CAMNT_0004510877 /DNA_START=1391 /DNA_END=1681 /DNA_ORIENTATION=+